MSLKFLWFQITNLQGSPVIMNSRVVVIYPPPPRTKIEPGKVPCCPLLGGGPARLQPKWASGFMSSSPATGSFWSPEFNRTLSWQKQALVLAHLTGVLFPFHFWRFADALYFPVNSVTHLKRYLFNTTLHCFLHFVQHLVF